MFETFTKYLSKALTRDSITHLPDVSFSNSAEDITEATMQKADYQSSLYLQKGLRIIKDAVCSVEFQVFKILNTKGEAERIEDHPILDLLDNPNPFQTRDEFLKLTIINYLISGEAYWRIFWAGAPLVSDVVGLININPDDVEVKFENQEIYFLYNTDGKQIRLTIGEVVHMKDPSPKDPLRGQGVLKYIAERIKAEALSVDYINGQFTRNGTPDGVLVYDQPVEQEEANKLRRRFLDSFKGVNKKDRVAVVFGKATYSQMSNNQNINAIEIQKQLMSDIASALGIPKSLLTSDDVNRANADAGLEQFTRFTLVPLLKGILGSINERLVIPYFGEDLYLDTQKLVSENKQDLINEINSTVNGRNQIVTVNEARQRLGYEPIEGGDTLNTAPSFSLGGAYQIQNAFKGRRALYKRLKATENIVKNAKKVAIEKTLKSETYKSLYKRAYNNNQDKSEYLIAGVIKAFMFSQRTRILANLENGNKVFDLADEKARFMEDVMPVYEKIARNAGNLALTPIKTFKPEVKYSSSIKLGKVLAKRAKFASKTINQTTYDAIQAIVAEKMDEGIPAVAQAITEKYDQITTGRANTIARTESCYITSMATQDAFEESPVVAGKTWLTADDGNVRDGDLPDNHVINDNKTVAKDDSFPNGESFPGELTINCRCAIAPVIDINSL